MVGNTIRLEIQGRRAEIEVVRLVGGSSGFVRRPFLYTGMLYGLGGALLAWAMVGGRGAGAARAGGRPWRSSTAARYTLSGPGLQQLGLVLAPGWGWAGWAPGWRRPATCRGIEPRA